MTSDEISLVTWILEHGEPAAAVYIAQIPNTRVCAHCSCGCASVDFEVGGVRHPGLIDILGDFEYRTEAGHECGAFVFAKGNLLAGLEVWSKDGQCTPSKLPATSMLRPLRSS